MSRHKEKAKATGSRPSEPMTSPGPGERNRGGSVLHEVGEVYVYIPPEISAAGVELKIPGSVRIVSTYKNGPVHLSWSPTDLSQQDVASLYLSEADAWTVVDQFVEPPEVIEARELAYPDTQYPSGSLDIPEPILNTGTRTEAEGKSHMMSSSEQGTTQVAEEVKATETGIKFSKDGDAHISGVVSHRHTNERTKAEAVNFPLSQLHSIKEAPPILQSSGKRSMTFYLLDGSVLPTLYFHDGGTSGLLNALQRYLYIVRDRKNDLLYLVKEFDKRKKHSLSSTSQKKGPIPDLVTGVLGGAMGNIIGITRAVRQHLIPDTRMEEVRPGTEDDDELEEKIQTVAMSEASQLREGRRGEREREREREGRREGDIDPEVSLITDFQVITDIRGKLPPRLPMLPAQPPLTLSEWETMRDGEGRISSDKENKIRARIFSGGIEPSLRKEVWRYLLNYFPFAETDTERMERQRKKEEEYWAMKNQWKAFTPEQERRFSKWREAKNLINKDVLRTDRDIDTFRDVNSPRLMQLEDILRTYVMYNFDLGYVQGMSDLLAPLLCVMDNEVDTFWCFVGFMEMVEHHFEESQTGMRNRLKQLRALLNVFDPHFYQFLKNKEVNNLYFCFRWLLIHFKREFDYPVLMRLWEVIWTNYLSPDYALFVAMAILETEKPNLFNPVYDFSDILQHINSLSGTISLDSVLQLAEILCRQLSECHDLPDDLKCLVVRPMPQRLERIAEMETIVCSPDSSSVPSADLDKTGPSDDRVVSLRNSPVPSMNRTPTGSSGTSAALKKDDLDSSSSDVVV